MTNIEAARVVSYAKNAYVNTPCQRNKLLFQRQDTRHMIRTMDKVLIQRINQRLEEVKRSAASVSVAATGSKETLRKILDGTTKNPRIDTIQKLAAVLETTPEWLTGDSTEKDPLRPSEVRAAEVPLPNRFQLPNDVPVRGTAAGSHLKGAFQISSDPIDYVRRPPALALAKDIYSLYVEGTSMEPQYFPGDLVYVNPHKPVRVGDAIIVQCRDGEEGYYEATLGVYVRKSEEHVTIRKHNPPAEVKILRKTIVCFHKVLTTNELFGV